MLIQHFNLKNIIKYQLYFFNYINITNFYLNYLILKKQIYNTYKR